MSDFINFVPQLEAEGEHVPCFISGEVPSGRRWCVMGRVESEKDAETVMRMLGWRGQIYSVMDGKTHKNTFFVKITTTDANMGALIKLKGLVMVGCRISPEVISMAKLGFVPQTPQTGSTGNVAAPTP